MKSLYQDPWFTFHFAEDRLISRIHLDGVAVGCPVSIYAIDTATQQRLDLLTESCVSMAGWVELAPPLHVRQGTTFIAEPQLASKLSGETGQ